MYLEKLKNESFKNPIGQISWVQNNNQNEINDSDSESTGKHLNRVIDNTNELKNKLVLTYYRYFSEENAFIEDANQQSSGNDHIIKNVLSASKKRVKIIYYKNEKKLVILGAIFFMIFTLLLLIEFIVKPDNIGSLNPKKESILF